MAELHDVADTATSLTYGVAVAALAGELLLLRILGERVDRRGGRASLLSGLLAFGGLAVAQRLVFAGVLLVAWEHRLLELGSGPGAWLAAFVAYDLMFYVAHRLGHELRILWCFHSVHHTSTEMRLVSAPHPHLRLDSQPHSQQHSHLELQHLKENPGSRAPTDLPARGHARDRVVTHLVRLHIRYRVSQD